MADKGISSTAVNALAGEGRLGQLVQDLILRVDNGAVGELINSAVNAFPMDKISGVTYHGSETENMWIDLAIKHGKNWRSDTNGRRTKSGMGATPLFSLDKYDYNLLGGTNISKTPIIVIGAGPAGLMATAQLIRMGFDRRNITVIDKSGEYGGIWNQRNVYEGGINSPYEFNFSGIYLESAPASGRVAKDFLSMIRHNNNLPTVVKGKVVEVIPSDLNHVVSSMEDGKLVTRTAALVINAIGNGLPLNPNRPGHMTTDTPGNAGIRWQKILQAGEASGEKVRGAKVVLIGLGNSTAEMLMQIQELNEAGYGIDYRVLTHYPANAVCNPTEEVVMNGKAYRVYRDLSIPNLTKYEGDLEEPRRAYERALYEGRIISDVSHWNMGEGKIHVVANGSEMALECTTLFTLIGYGHYPETLRRMGMKVTDEYKGTIATDYDGEVHRPEPIKDNGNRRNYIYPGYFALGAVAKTDSNPNAIVMPGIMHRMYDMLFTAALRAQEYRQAQEIVELTRKHLRTLKGSEEDIERIVSVAVEQVANTDMLGGILRE
ncbi:MAG: FAD-dependent oxidoreductase [Candidatus Micrarchaeota archaeon]|nr:FAD-dependent oxidoreductase [Candidatus Micrarchaeota archaeon]MDE1859775.1 FAD-dependent oxidoreductase [Candidatus Micrarchaeota archaeon]